MAKVKQPVSLDDIEFDALIEQEEKYEADVPEYPTEAGYSVSDNIALKPETLSMTLFVTNTPVTWRERFGANIDRVDGIVKQLKDLYFSRKLVTVTTSESVYENMAITEISIRKSVEVGYAREIPIGLKKVIVTESKTTTIPDSYGKSGTSEEAVGDASVTDGSSVDIGDDTDAGDSNGEGGVGISGSGGNSGSEDSNGSIAYNAGAAWGIW